MRTGNRQRCTTVMTAMLAMLPVASLASSEITVEDTRLLRAGAGELRRFGIKGADVVLFVGEGVGRNQVLGNVPRALELTYVYALRADQFAKAADKTLERNFSGSELASIADEIEALHALYQDVSKGDRYTISYIPGSGTTLALNGKALGTVPGETFAHMYFSIWLGEKPLSVKCRDRLLAGVRPPQEGGLA